MNRQEEMHLAQALSEAIWLRDHAENMDRQQLFDAVVSIGEYKLFSNRQISAITNGLVTHKIVGELIGKKNKTGGNLNVGTLDILRNILYSRANHRTDYNLVRDAVGLGTSQGMVSRLTGVTQSSISKRLDKDK
jgi:hypothetical protein